MPYSPQPAHPGALIFVPVMVGNKRQIRVSQADSRANDNTTRSRDFGRDRDVALP